MQNNFLNEAPTNDGLEVNLLSSTSNALEVAYAAIRSCYSAHDAVELFSFDYNKDDAIRLVRTIIANNHTSTLEHITFVFGIRNLSRACLSQLSRHRTGISLSVQSQRYVNQSSESKHGVFNFALPALSYLHDDERDKVYCALGDHLNAVQDLYDYLISLGVKAEDARSILPMNCTTNLVLTVNLRSLLNLINLRGDDSHAQDEFKELVKSMVAIVNYVEPWTVEVGIVD